MQCINYDEVEKGLTRKINKINETRCSWSFGTNTGY